MRLKKTWKGYQTIDGRFEITGEMGYWNRTKKFWAVREITGARYVNVPGIGTLRAAKQLIAAAIADATKGEAK